jgi:hypothetical protein
MGFQIGFLDLVANEFRIARHELGLDEKSLRIPAGSRAATAHSTSAARRS